MAALCRCFPDDSTLSAAFIHASALHVRNPDVVKKVAKTFLAARKDDLLLWEALGMLCNQAQHVIDSVHSHSLAYFRVVVVPLWSQR
jgi:hypothetical protein